MKKQTQWNHFKRNYLWVCLGFLVFGSAIWANSDPSSKYVAIPILVIGAVVIPLGNYLNWSGKWK